ncbi:MAG TPA: HDOD domain-containing protein [Bryobacteraceae bacterium]|nr:HDOD domain-containing protein [Bryobacteraceae bacterium]
MTETLARPQSPWALRLVPPFPAIAHRILTLVYREEVSASELGELIKKDPSFSAEMLKFANSAMFGLQREVSSIVQAVILLGLERVKTMATFIAMNKMVRASVRIEALRKIWLHSLITAVVAEEVARVSRLNAETAYTTGLLHNLGTLGMMSAYPIEYARMMEVTNEYGYDLLKTERDLFDIDHCAAGAYLAQDWDFTDELAAAIATHHDDPGPTPPGLDRVIQISWRVADTLGYAAFSSERHWAYEELVAMLPGTDRSWLCHSPETAREELKKKLSATPI